jgi:ribonuclease M5
VLVEGKYDKINIENFIDAYILCLDGFRIFKNEEKRELIKTLAKKDGIIVMTDSDSAGMVIRNHLKGVIDEGEIIQVYLPQIKGKEKRKEKHSAEGFLGVEGLSETVILDALTKAGVMGEKKEKRSEKTVTKTLFYELGLSGSSDSKSKREKFLSFLNLPKGMSANAMLDYFGRIMSKEEFTEVYEEWLSQKDSN